YISPISRLIKSAKIIPYYSQPDLEDITEEDSLSQPIYSMIRKNNEERKIEKRERPDSIIEPAFSENSSISTGDNSEVNNAAKLGLLTYINQQREKLKVKRADLKEFGTILKEIVTKKPDDLFENPQKKVKFETSPEKEIMEYQEELTCDCGCME